MTEAYLWTLTSLFAIQVVLAMSLNLVMGLGGLVSMAHGCLMAVGAYSAAHAAITWEWPVVLAMGCGALVAGAVGWLFALAATRLSGDEFILASFAFQMVVIEIISRWTSVTRGTYGLSGVPRPTVLGEPLVRVEQYAVFVLVVAGACVLLMVHLARSSWGLALRGIRESRQGMQALGYATSRRTVGVLTLAAILAGVAGGLQASMIRFIHPDSFGVMVSIVVVAYLLVGGVGNMVGVALGAVALMSLPELIAATDLVPSRLAGPTEHLVYGLVLMAFVAARPKGLLPERPIIDVGRMTRRGIVSTRPTGETHG